jgi:hypothetical protein
LPRNLELLKLGKMLFNIGHPIEDDGEDGQHFFTQQ